MSAGSSTLFSGGTQGQNSRALLRVVILALIAGTAIASRLFSVIRESTHLASWPVLGQLAPAIMSVVCHCTDICCINGSIMLTGLFLCYRLREYHP